MSESESSNFPGHWQERTLGEILEVVRGVSFPSEDKKQSPEEDHIACLRTANVQDTVDWDDLWHIPEEHVSREEQYIRENDILISTANSYELVGKVSLVRDLPKRATLGAFISLIRVPEELDSKFFFYQLRSTEVRNEMRQRASTTTNISNISTSDLNEVPLGVPPLPEQRRIVAEIEELFSNLDAGMDDLHTAGQQLERYRLSVLQAAVEGRLTADWRRTHDLEPAEKLLERAEAKETVNKYKNRGKLTEPDESLMYEIPETWEWVQIGDLASAIRYGTSDKAKKDNDGVPMLRMGDIENGELHYDDLKYLPVDWEDKEKFLLRDGDILFNRTNSAELVGKTAVYKASHPEAVFASYLVRARLYSDVYVPELMAYYINSIQGRKYINSVVSQQVGQANVNATKMASMPIPLPPLAEQKQIVNEIERLLSVADDAAATAERERTRADRLRQSILEQAFSGQLVPHDEDAPPPSIDGTAPEHSDSDGSDGSDSDVEDLLGSTDPDKQIEMDL